jgi:hypothetical protein
VPSVWVVTPTESLNARQPCSGITPSPPLPFAPTKSSPCGTENQFSATGSVSPVVPVPGMIAGISAQVALLHPTEPRSVLERRKLVALTPYNPLVWESLLLESGLIQRSPLLPQNLCTGFLINIPNISLTQAPPNNPVIHKYQAQFNKIVDLEISKQHYLGPFSRQLTEDLIGPFQSSPFSIIPKPGKPNRFRLIQNYSFPHDVTPHHINPSINSFLDSDEFPTSWGTFTIISLLIHQLPPHSQIATRDVAEAYRTISLHHSQWPGTVVRTGEDAFCIDTTAAFGFSPSSGVYGKVADAGADIFRFRGVALLIKWVDDHAFFRI